MDIVREVMRLRNIEAIRTLIAKYALAADAYSPPDMMRPLFSRVAGWHCEALGAHYEGLDAVTSGLAQVREHAVLWTMHFNVAPLIEVSDDGTTGTAFWYLWELARTSLDGGPERQNTWIAGSYRQPCCSRTILALRPGGSEPAPRRTGRRTGVAGRLDCRHRVPIKFWSDRHCRRTKVHRHARRAVVRSAEKSARPARPPHRVH